MYLYTFRNPGNMQNMSKINTESRRSSHWSLSLTGRSHEAHHLSRHGGGTFEFSWTAKVSQLQFPVWYEEYISTCAVTELTSVALSYDISYYISGSQMGVHVPPGVHFGKISGYILCYERFTHWQHSDLCIINPQVWNFEVKQCQESYVLPHPHFIVIVLRDFIAANIKGGKLVTSSL